MTGHPQHDDVSVSRWRRVWRHMVTDHRDAAKLFPVETLKRLELATRHGEQLHRGQVRLAIEASLPTANVRRGMTPRERALEVFGLLRLWDTDANCGVLLYLLVADRAFEIIADRGIHARVGEAAWGEISERIEARFRAGEFSQGAQQALVEIGSLLALHFPRSARDAGDRANEQPDAPVIIG